METEVLVYVDIGGTPHLAGRLWARVRKGRESATFEYDAGWLAYANRFALEPALTLGPGPFHTTSGSPLFGTIGDSAPDRWGRVLMRRAERRRAERVGETPRTLMEIDYLLGVDDEARQGALRFANQEGGPFLAEHETARIPPLIDLPQLLSAAEHVVGDTDSDEDLRLLLAPGSSLGGARPKASVRDRDGHLTIAKFPHKDDEINAVLWEGVALRLAAKSGIPVPDWRIEHVLNKPVLLLRRFDRVQGDRIPFLSAMSMLGASDNESRSYLEFVDALRRYGASPIQDMHELWRRIVFNILISNTDDHLRNHAFLYTGPDGWRLAPAYDLNPVPTDIKPRVLTTAIDLDDGSASLDLAMSVVGYFELDENKAHAIAAEVGMAVRTWREEAAKLGLTRAEIDRMASAFEHEDLKGALSLS
ncbi:MAG: type II toxin-antitoxin system HipA family toxin [endosymbiont of Escarpia spicata]|uniref:Type II toxin-antitoxin system HipA family toxin n=1 Tax=endosymbiont of Escarpia spicata TaxID=2200908 RepID=A0A370DRK6_9GAMM|nr:MAG: type II toxin-antitoxin system HipA family toxin [endosymbiont of Escarpia spicata]